MRKGKIAFVFPGQGAQKINMGRSLYNVCPTCGSIMDRAVKILGFDLNRLCLEGPEEDLSQTENTQPALFTVSAMALEAFRAKTDIKPDFVAGHSLGEFSALYAAGALSFEDTLRIVRKRGEYMARAKGGVMAAVLGLGTAAVERICYEVSNAPNWLKPANYNGYKQIVVAGTKTALEIAIPLLKQMGAKKIIPLKVSGAFHTPYVQSAADKLAVDLDELPSNEIQVPLINNVDAKIISNIKDAIDGLKRQVVGAVRWTDVMCLLLENGVKTVVEFGPGKTLTGLFKRIDGSLTLCNVEDEESLKKTLEVLA